MIDPFLVRTELKSYINSDKIKFPYDHMVAMTGSVEYLKLDANPI
jgi:hypothetical protein